MTAKAGQTPEAGSREARRGIVVRRGSSVSSRGPLLALLAFAALSAVAAAVPAAGAREAEATSASLSGAASKCRTVVRKVKGKRRRVRVCAKPKPKSPPATRKDVSLTLERSRAASATVGATGGTISARAAGGAVLTVTVPAGALSEDTAVTVTPVAKLSGVANVRLLAGVELGPEGTALAKPATITLTLPGPRKAPSASPGSARAGTRTATRSSAAARG